MKTPWRKPPEIQGRASDVFKRGALYTTKDIACAMLLHPRTVKRWWRRLNVPPLVSVNGCHRWTFRQCVTLLNRWAKYRAQYRAAAGWRNGKKYPA